MLAIKGLFDGMGVKLLEKTNIRKPQKVIIIFPEIGDTSDNEITHKGLYKIAEMGDAFDFLNDPEEDIYSDDDLKVKYEND